MNPTQDYPHLVRELVLTWAQRFIAFSEGVSWLSENCCGRTDPTIQIFDDGVVAFTRLIDLLLLISTTFRTFATAGSVTPRPATLMATAIPMNATPILRKVSSRTFTG